MQASLDRTADAIVQTERAGRPRRRLSRQESYSSAGIEPCLEDLLNDPLTLTLMARDGVNSVNLRELLQSARRTLRSRSGA
jgi:hypothetical protein